MNPRLRGHKLKTGAADICTASSSLAISTGRGRLDEMERTSTSGSSLTKLSASIASQSEIIVPDALKKATLWRRADRCDV
jgi:hypothetical protein